MRIYRLIPILVVAASCSRDEHSKTAFNQVAASGYTTDSASPVTEARRAFADSRAPAAKPTAQAPAPVLQRKLIRSAELRIEVRDVAEAVRLVDNAARTHEAVTAGAHIVQVADKRRDGNLTIQVPAARFDVMLAELRQLGTVKNENVSTADVTKVYHDLETRLTVKQQTVTRLQGLLATRTAKLADILEVERELDRSIAELEQMKGERRYYDQLVAVSSISLALFEPPVVVRAQLSDPVKIALTKSLETLGTSAGAVIYLVTFLIPWIVLATIFWWILTRLGVRWPIRHVNRILES